MSNLTFYDRRRIEYYLNFRSLSLRKTAKLIGRYHSVVLREVKRNKSNYGLYDANLAQAIAKRKARNTNKHKLDKHEALKDYVIKKLKSDWSPQQIAGRLKTNSPPELKDKYICTETIYQYIYQIEPYLYNYLRKKHFNRIKQ